MAGSSSGFCMGTVSCICIVLCILYRDPRAASNGFLHGFLANRFGTSWCRNRLSARQNVPPAQLAGSHGAEQRLGHASWAQGRRTG